MNDPLENIQRYDYCDWGMESDKFGEYVKFSDVQNIIKELLRNHELELDKEYANGYEKGLDAAYITNQ
jgi:hypothetical protein